jgi:diguanylate cyclase (GGDEF)-like protein
MGVPPFANRLKMRVAAQDWPWWRLPPLLRWYVAMPPLVAGAVMGVAAANTAWRSQDLLKFLLLLCCGMVSVASTPRIAYTSGGATRDFSTVWVVPTAILLPPIYAAIMPIPLLVTMQIMVHRGVIYRRVFTAASISVPYAAASATFHSLPASFAGGMVGAQWHALTWVLAVAACEIIGGRAHHFLIVGAVKLSDPKVRLRDLEWNREALQGDFVEMDLGILITLSVTLSPALVILALPTVLLVRRFLIFPALVAQSRVDAKTGLLNVSTWEREAAGELSRSIRTRNSLALAIVDIDHFKRVNDTYGHLVGDMVLKAVAAALKGQLRDYDRAGRFGGEEFVLLLAQTDRDDACHIADRLRLHIADMGVPIDDLPDAPIVQVTISIGVAVLERDEPQELTDLLTAADSALYRAKETGRNRVCMAAPVQAGQLVAALTDQMETVRADSTGASLCPEMSLYAIVTER